MFVSAGQLPHAQYLSTKICMANAFILLFPSYTNEFDIFNLFAITVINFIMVFLPRLTMLRPHSCHLYSHWVLPCLTLKLKSYL